MAHGAPPPDDDAPAPLSRLARPHGARKVAFADIDYTKRLERSVILNALDEINRGN